MKKLLAIVVAVLFAVTMFAGCTTNAPSTSVAPSVKPSEVVGSSDRSSVGSSDRSSGNGL
jgi:curli biogenesis system outer membrane secretion channel CsgG